MNVNPLKTRKVTAGSVSIFDFLDESIKDLSEKSVVAISSKVVSICEGRVVPLDSIKKDDLVAQESERYLPRHTSKHGFSFTITQNTLIASAGIDESNSDGNFVLWPKDPQKSANTIREYLADRFDLKNVGVVITDSTCMPLRWGAVGIALAYSGFKATNDYASKKDLFGRKLVFGKTAVASGLAASAVLAMGEGAEQTPIVIIGGLESIQFQPRNPTAEELKYFSIQDTDEDLFYPFLSKATWKKGQNKK